MDPINTLMGDNWPVRRMVMFAFLMWCASIVSWVLVRGHDNPLYQQTVLALIAAMTSIIVAYVFGAVWDDHNKRMIAPNQPSWSDNSPQTPPVTPPPPPAPSPSDSTPAAPPPPSAPTNSPPPPPPPPLNLSFS